MKMRTLLAAVLLTGGFVYLTSVGRWSRLIPAFSSTERGWSGPDRGRQAGLGADELNNIDIYKIAHQATVNITSTVYQRGWFLEIIPQKGTGSGFFIDEDGRILTNNHVVSGSQELEVTLADAKHSRYKATILARDPSIDIALIKINPRGKLPFLRLGDSDPVQVGQKVLAIGNPFGLEGTLTTGVISSLGRNLRDETGRTLEGMFQTDAAINPGNSGGPLLDSRGNVVAINTAIYGPGSNIGIGFAMPINRAKGMLDEFHARGRYNRPKLGTQVMYLSGDWAEALELPATGGLLIVEVESGSAAEEAGLRGPRRTVVVGNYEIPVGGDFITAIEGSPVTGNGDLSRALSKKRPGDILELTIYRGGRAMKVKVKLGEAPQSL